MYNIVMNSFEVLKGIISAGSTHDEKLSEEVST